MNGRPMSAEEIAKLASELLVKAYVKEAGASLAHRDSIFYFTVKKVFSKGPEGRRLASSSDLILISYGVGGVEKAKVLDDFARRGILRAYGREEDTEVSSRKTYMLVEPVKSTDEAELAEVLRLHGVNPDNPASLISPVHALHALMLYSLKPKDVFLRFYEKLYSHNPGLVSEAVELAKALSTLRGDPEAELATRILDYLGIVSNSARRDKTLYDFSRR